MKILEAKQNPENTRKGKFPFMPPLPERKRNPPFFFLFRSSFILLSLSLQNHSLFGSLLYPLFSLLSLSLSLSLFSSSPIWCTTLLFHIYILVLLHYSHTHIHHFCNIQFIILVLNNALSTKLFAWCISCREILSSKSKTPSTTTTAAIFSTG